MKDVTNYINQSIYDLLDGNVTYLTKEVPVYTIPPVDAGGLYIWIKEVQTYSSELTTKDAYGHDALVTIEVVYSKQVSRLSKMPVNNVTAQVVTLLVGDPGSTFGLGSSDHTMIVSNINSTLELEEKTETGRIMRRLIKLMLNIQET